MRMRFFIYSRIFFIFLSALRWRPFFNLKTFCVLFSIFLLFLHTQRRVMRKRGNSECTLKKGKDVENWPDFLLILIGFFFFFIFPLQCGGWEDAERIEEFLNPFFERGKINFYFLFFLWFFLPSLKNWRSEGDFWGGWWSNNFFPFSFSTSFQDENLKIKNSEFSLYIFILIIFKRKKLSKLQCTVLAVFCCSLLSLSFSLLIFSFQGRFFN